MRLGAKLSFAAVAALLLASSSYARADSTYNLATTTSFVGTLSGTITGTGDTFTGFDVTAVNGPNTYVFDSSVADDSGSFLPYTGYTLPDGTPLNVISLVDAADDLFSLIVVGDFTTGLTPLEAGQTIYQNGGDCCSYIGATVFTTSSGIPAVNDDVSLTLQPNVAPTPEPSSWLLLATGLAGLGALALRQNRPIHTRTRHLPHPLSA